jgi:hypothetical protein
MSYCGPRGIALSTFLSWTPEDQEAALAWQTHEARRHATCGTHPEDFPSREPSDVHFHPAVCRGCQELERAREQLAADHDVTRGLSIVTAVGPAAECAVCNPTRSADRRDAQ